MGREFTFAELFCLALCFTVLVLGAYELARFAALSLIATARRIASWWRDRQIPKGWQPRKAKRRPR